MFAGLVRWQTLDSRLRGNDEKVVNLRHVSNQVFLCFSAHGTCAGSY